MSYFIARAIVNGFETVFIVFGTENAARDYLNKSFRIPITYSPIDYSTVKHLEDIGFKVYCVPMSNDKPESKDE